MSKENLLESVAEMLATQCLGANKYPSALVEEYMASHPDSLFTAQELLDATVAVHTDIDSED